MPFLNKQGEGLFKFCIIVQCHERYLLCTFYSGLIYFGQKIIHRSEIIELSSGWVKIQKIPMSYLKPQVSFSLNFVSLFSVMIDNSSVYTFFDETLYEFDKRIPFKCKISDFILLRWNFAKFVLSEAPFVESI